MTRRSPQEKKALSYARDARNHYGQSDKGSRKAIARHKRHNVRADRRQEHLVLITAHPDDLESELGRKRRPSRAWRKLNDRPLADDVAAKLRRRVLAGIITEELAKEKIATLPPAPRRSVWK